MENSCHKGHLRVLANLMTGCNKDLSITAPDIVDFLHLPSTCYSKEVSKLSVLNIIGTYWSPSPLQCVYQMQIVRCCCALLKTCGPDCLPLAQQLFDILVSVDSVTTSEAVHERVEGICVLSTFSLSIMYYSLDMYYWFLDGLCQLEDIAGMGSRAGLYNKFTHELLREVTASPDSWTVHSPQRFIFQHILLNAGNYLGTFITAIPNTSSMSYGVETRVWNFKFQASIGTEIKLRIFLRNQSGNEV